ncbi:hypothetical protein PMA4326_028630 (plasmid) [Pseudomonas syringae pv. maculicola str. ES4326]|uniref:Uncharacterized protein n=2 Tax=Pseudomonas TaxID=286 RepID=A0A8T8CAH4_PSEYM|nr:hypothetical protein PMA4326_028630 [Pseudomonas syringae pv. maculicola str. ES4326]
MKEIQKNLTGTLFAAPLVFIGWCCLSFLWRGYVPGDLFWSVTLSTASCMSIFVWLVLSKRKAIRNRLYLNIRPNLVEIEGDEKFRGEFSSETSFLISTDAFRETLNSIVTRDSYTRGRFVFAREAAYVRIWPGNIGISDLEAEAIHNALAEEFFELEVKVVQDGDGQLPHATAVKA